MKAANFPTIIANNCLGGIIYHDHQEQFTSPFINLFIKSDQFVKMLKNLDWYLEQELKFSDAITRSPYKWQPHYPCAYLGDIEIHFMHYNSNEEAKEKWESRLERMDKENLAVILTQNPNYSKEVAEEFLQLPFEKKLIIENEKQVESPNVVIMEAKDKFIDYSLLRIQSFFNVDEFLFNGKVEKAPLAIALGKAETSRKMEQFKKKRLLPIKWKLQAFKGKLNQWKWKVKNLKWPILRMKNKVKNQFNRVWNCQKLRTFRMRFLPIFETKRLYRQIMKSELNLKNPQTFSEKVNYLKLFTYAKDEEVALAGDKVGLHQFLKERNLTDYSVNVLAVYDKVEDIDWQALPQKFVMKKSNGWGDVLLVEDKSKLDIEKSKQLLQSWMDAKHWYQSGERHYSRMLGKIIVEEFMEDIGDEYQIFCYNGVPKSFQFLTYHFKDENGVGANSEKIMGERVYLDITDIQEDQKPPFYQEMLEISAIASSGFPLVRVDFIRANGKLYIGEMTFTPASGYHKSLSEEKQKLWGSWLQLPV